MRDDSILTLKDKAERAQSDDEDCASARTVSKRTKLEDQLAASLAARDVRKREESDTERKRIELDSNKIDLEREKVKVEELRLQAEVKKEEQKAKVDDQRLVLERDRLVMEMKDREDARKAAADNQQVQHALLLGFVKHCKNSRILVPDSSSATEQLVHCAGIVLVNFL